MTKQRKINLSLDELSWRSAQTLPREINISQIVRWILIALVTPEKKLRAMVENNTEAQKVRDYLVEIGEKLKE